MGVYDPTSTTPGGASPWDEAPYDPTSVQPLAPLKQTTGSGQPGSPAKTGTKPTNAPSYAPPQGSVPNGYTGSGATATGLPPAFGNYTPPHTAPQTPNQQGPTDNTDTFGSPFNPNNNRFKQDFYEENKGRFGLNQGADFLEQSGAYDTFSTPGQFQQHFDQNAESFGAPGAGDQHWQGNQGAVNKFSSGVQGPNNANTAFTGMQNAMPGSIQPTFDAFYDRSLDKGISRMNTEAASRGAYGSSAALTGVGGVISDIEAQRADRASDFAIADSANQRNWHTAASNAGRASDLTNMGMFDSGANAFTNMGNLAQGVSTEQLARDKFAAGIAQDAQTMEQDRLMQGADLAFKESGENLSMLQGEGVAAGQASNEFGDRAGLAFDQNMMYGSAIAGILQGGMNQIISGDQAMQEDLWKAALGDAAGAQAYQDYIKQGNADAVNTVADIYTYGAASKTNAAGGGN